jgi:two-component system chemotaxis sensor kinase CheA
MGDATTTAEPARTEAGSKAADAQEKRTLLLFRAGSDSPKAVPLQSISRLEEFDRRQIERVNGRYVIQYRGVLTPLVTFDPLMTLAQEGRQPALVFTYEGQVLALLVDEIVDIVETTLDVHHGRSKPGITGSAIIAGRATELIDANYFCKQAVEADDGQDRPLRDDAELRSLLFANPALAPLAAALLKAA